MNQLIYNPAKIVNPVIIYDMNNEYGDPVESGGYGIKAMHIEHIPAFMAHPKKEIRRIVPFHFTGKGLKKYSSGEMLENLERVVNMYQGGCLVVEDPSKMIGKAVTDDITGAICTNRHNSCDMILHYQSVGRILPVLHENINIYRFHNQKDDVMRSENKLEEYTDIFKIAQIMVQDEIARMKKTLSQQEIIENRHKRYFVFVDKDSGQIKGDYNNKQFSAALDYFIKFGYADLKPWTRQLDDNGRKVYTYPQAVAACKEQLYEKYYWMGEPDRKLREALFMAAIGEKGVGKTRETMRFLLQEYCVAA